LHGNLAALERILADAGPVDAILLGGDITHFGSPADAQAAVRLAQTSGAAVLAVAGNCDSPEIDRHLVQMGVSLHARGVSLDAIGLHGLSAIPPWRAGMHQFTEEELAAALEAGFAQLGGAAKHGMLVHVPPHGLSLDRIVLGRHAGSTAVRAFVEKAEPCLVVCGHIHESAGVEQLGPTTVVNCGYAAVGHYARIDVDDQVKVGLHRA
jgi:Icc-related predicted phosphoesterase